MVCPLIYKELTNHPDVEKYERVKGCDVNLFFIDHQYHEEIVSAIFNFEMHIFEILFAVLLHLGSRIKKLLQPIRNRSR